MADLTQEEWTKQLKEDKNAIVLDVRTQNEVSEGIIPKAKHIDILQPQRFVDQIKELDKDKSYYVYCRVGGRSAQACEIMKQLGFNQTYNLIGGISEWTGERSKLS